jgi:protein MAK11
LPTLQVAPIFSFPAHLSSIKSVASSTLASPGTGSERKVGGKYLVSGGTDEVIKVWDLKRKKEVGSLEGEASGSFCIFLAGMQCLLRISVYEQGP